MIHPGGVVVGCRAADHVVQTIFVHDGIQRQSSADRLMLLMQKDLATVFCDHCQCITFAVIIIIMIQPKMYRKRCTIKSQLTAH
jgi:hypothetical protein